MLVSDWTIKCHVLVYCFKPTSSQCFTHFFAVYYDFSAPNKSVESLYKGIYSCSAFKYRLRVWFVLRELISGFSERELMQYLSPALGLSVSVHASCFIL